MKLNNIEISGLVVLFIGVILLAFTFVSAYGFLIGKLSILASADLIEVFGRAMAPLIEAVIHILYLGVMGWIGSILTIRGVQLVKQEKMATPLPQPQPPATKQEAKRPVPAPVEPAASGPATKTEPKPEAKTEVKEPKAEATEPKKAENLEKASAPEPTKEPQIEAQASK